MADATPVVLLHGFAQGSEAWGEVAVLLLESGAFGSAYALDFAGHGKSLRADCCGGLDAAQIGKAFSDDVRAYEMDAACEAVRSFVELVACREGAAPVLVGYSMGGRIALECLVRCSLSISALVLESAGLGPADETVRLALEKRNLAWARRLREEGVASFMDYWQDLPLFESQRALPPERQAAQRTARLANDAETLARTFEGTGAHRQAFEAASLAALRDAAAAGLPVLYLAGSLDAKYRAAAQRIAAGCGVGQSAVADCDVAQSAAASCRVFGDEPPGGFPCASAACGRASKGAPEAVVVKGVGHNIHLEKPEEFARILGCFAAGAGLAR